MFRVLCFEGSPAFEAISSAQPAFFGNCLLRQLPSSATPFFVYPPPTPSHHPPTPSLTAPPLHHLTPPSDSHRIASWTAQPIRSLPAKRRYIIDLALPDHRVALLVGGKAHHDRLPGADGTHPPKAATRLRWRQVGAMGWKLISVPFYEWDALSDPVARRGYLRRKLLALLPLRLEA